MKAVEKMNGTLNTHYERRTINMVLAKIPIPRILALSADGSQVNQSTLATASFSPDKTRMAIFANNIDAKTPGGEVLINGQSIGSFARLSGPIIWSARGSRYAFAGVQSAQGTASRPMSPPKDQVMVVDGATHGPYSAIHEGYSFDPTGNRFGFVVHDYTGDEKQYFTDLVMRQMFGQMKEVKDANLHMTSPGKQTRAVIDGIPQQPYSDIISPVIFSNDGTRHAYIAVPDPLTAEHDENTVMMNARVVAVIDSIASEPFEDIMTIVFSPDSQHVLFNGRNGQAWSLVVDGYASSLDSACLLPVFRPRSNDICYYTGEQRNGISRFAAVLHGHRQDWFDQMAAAPIQFSEDGEHYVYFGKKKEGWFLVRDGKLFGHYDSIDWSSLVMSNDGRHFACVVFQKSQRLILHDGSTIGPYQEACKPTFSPDGSRLGYFAAHGRDWMAVIDGIESPPFEAPVGAIHFSPNSEHIAYIRGINNSAGGAFCVTVIDNHVSHPFPVMYPSPKDTPWKTNDIVDVLAMEMDQNLLKFYRARNCLSPRARVPQFADSTHVVMLGGGRSDPRAQIEADLKLPVFTRGTKDQ